MIDTGQYAAMADKPRNTDEGVFKRHVERTVALRAERPYTIVGFYPDNQQPFVDHVTAVDRVHAADAGPDAVVIVAVFDGHITESEK